MEPLDAVQSRVVACLVEKQLTTPQQYPLSLNALTLACNQSSSRDPVTAYGEDEVRAALDGLKAKGLVRFVLPSHGRSVVRYRHVLDERLALDAKQSAVVAVLVLRGPQTAAELRTRTERMAPFETVREVESDLEGLAGRPEPLVERRPRAPGQKEERWTQLLGEPVTTAARGDATEAAGPTPDASTASGGTFESLRGEVELLREEVRSLGLAVAAIRAELGMEGGPGDPD